MRMVLASTLDSPGKMSYKNRDLVCSPQDYESVAFPPEIGKHRRGNQERRIARDFARELSELARTNKFTLIEVLAKTKRVVRDSGGQDTEQRSADLYLQKRVTVASELLKTIERTEEYKA
ncbi:hypothetical protein EMCRGX_G006187 [Ephydatia muelleri]